MNRLTHISLYPPACKPDIDSKNECTVVNGRIRLFLSNRDTADDAITLATKQIQKAFGKSIFVNRVETGLRKITFIPDEISEIQDNSISKVSSGREAADDENRISPTSSFLVAFASALLAALVGSVYYLRQGKKRDVEALQEEDGSSFAPPIQNKVRPTSPFSEMLPGAYRMGDLDKMSMLSNSNMSPVYEDEDGSSSVVVSESGYTTEAAGTDGGDDSSLTFSKRALYTPEEEKDYMSSSSLDCLGAIPRDGNQFTSDLEMSDSDFDASSVESSQTSPLKTYSTSLLLPQGHQDESMTAEDILLFENAETVVIENSMVDVSLSEP